MPSSEAGSKPPKALQFGSMAELNELITVPKKFKAEQLVKTMSKLVENSANSEAEGDQEKAYILAMKFLEALSHIKTTSDYKKDKAYYNSMIGNGNILSCMERSERLSSELEERYTALKKLEEAAAAAEKERKAAKMRARAELEASKPKKDPRIITSKELYDLIESKCGTFLILDCRPLADYHATHVNHPYSISVPEEEVKPGCTVNHLRKNIPIESRMSFDKRLTSDVVIVADWDSECLTPKTPLEHLWNAMTKWDSGATYKCGEPKVLARGFEDFALRYPMKVTNPRVKKPGKAKKEVVVASLDAVNYPDFNNGFLVTPSPPRTTSNPLEAELSREVASGAVTVIRQPAIPDRTTKPRESSSTATYNESSIGLNTQARFDSLDSPGSSDASSDYTGSPVKRRTVQESDNLEEVLKAEKSLAEESIALNKKELDIENNLEIFRLKKKNAATEEMAQEMALKEEQLLDDLEKVTLESKTRSEENKQLKERLKELERELEVKARNEQKQQETLRREREAREQMERKRVEDDRLRAEIAMKRRERKEAERRTKERKALEEEARRKKNESVTRVPLKRDDSSGGFGGGMSRSLSSPNINKSLEEEEEGKAAAVPRPTLDRNTKPIMARKDFQQVWQASPKPGLTGLKNLGNTCYMNSVLQCLSNFTFLASYFMKLRDEDINERSATRGEFASEFAAVIEELWKGNYKSFAPANFKHVFGRYKEEFRGFSQQDAHEFLAKLMESLHDDVNEIREKVKLPEVEFEKYSEMDGAKKAWEMAKQVDKSFVHELFYGQMKSSLRCLTCGFESPKYETFFQLSLSLPEGNSNCSVRQCLEAYLRPESVEWNCPKCKRNRNSHKKLDIVRFPLILIIHLSRFYSTEMGSTGKKKNFVDFELRNFNVGAYARAVNGQLNRYENYRLFGVVNHFGSLEGGHYTASCFSQVHGKWYKYDDHEVNSMSESNVKSSAGYMLFYTAKNQ